MKVSDAKLPCFGTHKQKEGYPPTGTVIEFTSDWIHPEFGRLGIGTVVKRATNPLIYALCIANDVDVEKETYSDFMLDKFVVCDKDGNILEDTPKDATIH